MKRSFGLEHYNTGIIMAALAETHGELGDFHNKRVLLEQSLHIVQLEFGPDHHSVAVYLTELAQTCDKLGDESRRDAFLERARQIRSRLQASTSEEAASA